MTTWTSDELTKIGAAEELRNESLRSDYRGISIGFRLVLSVNE